MFQGSASVAAEGSRGRTAHLAIRVCIQATRNSFEIREGCDGSLPLSSELAHVGGRGIDRRMERFSIRAKTDSMILYELRLFVAPRSESPRHPLFRELVNNNCIIVMTE